MPQTQGAPRRQRLSPMLASTEKRGRAPSPRPATRTRPARAAAVSVWCPSTYLSRLREKAGDPVVSPAPEKRGPNKKRDWPGAGEKSLSPFPFSCALAPGLRQTRAPRGLPSCTSCRPKERASAHAPPPSTPPRSTTATPAGTPSTAPRPTALDRLRAHAAGWLEADDSDGSHGGSDEEEGVSDVPSSEQSDSPFIVSDGDDVDDSQPSGSALPSSSSPPARAFFAAVADSQPSPRVGRGATTTMDETDAHAAYVAAAIAATIDPGHRPTGAAGVAVDLIERALARARELAVASQAWRKADPALLLALESCPHAVAAAPSSAGRGGGGRPCATCGRAHAAAPRSSLTLSGGPASPFHLRSPPRRLADVDAGVAAALSGRESEGGAARGGTWLLGDTCLARLLLFHALVWYGTRVADAARTRLAVAARTAPPPGAALDAATADAGLAVVLYRDYASLAAAADACLRLHSDDGDGRGGATARAAAFHSRVARAVAAFDEPRYGGQGRAVSEWWTQNGVARAVATVDASTQTGGGGGRGGAVIETDSD